MPSPRWPASGACAQVDVSRRRRAQRRIAAVTDRARSIASNGTFPTGDGIVSSPGAQGWRFIYFGGDGRQNIYAVDAADGRQRWESAKDGTVPFQPRLDRRSTATRCT
jgi:hypothetical protein